MIFHQLDIPGALLLEPEGPADRRGFFARRYCRRELERRGLDPALVRSEVSVNRLRGTVCGLHYQVAPYEEVRLVRCTAGRIFDVIVDLRRDSPTFRQWVSMTLSAENKRMAWIPPGFAHGFYVTSETAEFQYKCTDYYHPEHECSLRWDDSELGIPWPLVDGKPPMLSAKDQAGLPLTDAPTL